MTVLLVLALAAVAGCLWLFSPLSDAPDELRPCRCGRPTTGSTCSACEHADLLR